MQTWQRTLALALGAPLAVACSAPRAEDRVVDVSAPSASATGPAATSEPATRQPAKTDTFKACVAEIRRRPVRGSQSDPAESLYRQALAAEDSDTDAARKLHFKLIDENGKSPYAAASYCAFGELFLKDAERDDYKLQFAQAAYEEVLKRAAPGSPLLWLARLRLGQVFARAQSHDKALDSLWRLLRELAAAPPGERFCGEDRAASDFSAVYVAMGDPKKAASFVRGVGQSRLANRLLVDLTRAYADKAMLSEARDVLDGAANAPLEGDDYLCMEGRRVAGVVEHPPMQAAIERACSP